MSPEESLEALNRESFPLNHARNRILFFKQLHNFLRFLTAAALSAL